MVGNQPWGPGGGPAAQPPVGNWPSNYSGQPAPRPRPWQAIALAVTAVVATAALVVAVVRPTESPAPATTSTPTYSPAEVTAAQQELCDTYKLAARAVQVDTNGSDKAFARIALTNSAVMLSNAATDPALDAEHRNAARALAAAYLTDTAKSSEGAATEAEFRAAVDDVNAKDAVMKRVCGGG
ncbi:hypothetical protein [Mycobacterium sp. 4858]|uniref:hypothetical protein n=1 Tax=Mycobacterium sp. 4858 TaxID=2057185 RepID=UPI000C827BB7|nr:hypothetical protein [Mycobacterium sp. 4858]